MIAYFVPDTQGTGDDLVALVAHGLRTKGHNLAGVIQVNSAEQGGRRSKMALHLLGSKRQISISQDLGPLATGCALDPEGLENAAQLVAQQLDQNIDLLILNKFGKQERDGQGFRDVLVKALDLEVPVLLGVNPVLEGAFKQFAGEFAEKVDPTPLAIENWFERQLS